MATTGGFLQEELLELHDFEVESKKLRTEEGDLVHKGEVAVLAVGLLTTLLSGFSSFTGIDSSNGLSCLNAMVFSSVAGGSLLLICGTAVVIAWKKVTSLKPQVSLVERNHQILLDKVSSFQTKTSKKLSDEDKSVNPPLPSLPQSVPPPSSNNNTPSDDHVVTMDDTAIQSGSATSESHSSFQTKTSIRLSDEDKSVNPALPSLSQSVPPPSSNNNTPSDDHVVTMDDTAIQSDSATPESQGTSLFLYNPFTYINALPYPRLRNPFKKSNQPHGQEDQDLLTPLLPKVHKGPKLGPIRFRLSLLTTSHMLPSRYMLCYKIVLIAVMISAVVSAFGVCFSSYAKACK